LRRNNPGPAGLLTSKGRFVVSDNPELAMMTIVMMIMVLIFAVVWFVFMVPMEKGLHKRRMELIQKKLREKEERLKQRQREARNAEEDRNDADNVSAG
jgi:F0F1-type ATP synthase membrane subunit b/b'